MRRPIARPTGCVITRPMRRFTVRVVGRVDACAARHTASLPVSSHVPSPCLAHTRVRFVRPSGGREMYRVVRRDRVISMTARVAPALIPVAWWSSANLGGALPSRWKAE